MYFVNYEETEWMTILFIFSESYNRSCTKSLVPGVMLLPTKMFQIFWKECVVQHRFLHLRFLQFKTTQPCETDVGGKCFNHGLEERVSTGSIVNAEMRKLKQTLTTHIAKRRWFADSLYTARPFSLWLIKYIWYTS